MLILQELREAPWQSDSDREALSRALARLQESMIAARTDSDEDASGNIVIRLGGGSVFPLGGSVWRRGVVDVARAAAASREEITSGALRRSLAQGTPVSACNELKVARLLMQTGRNRRREQYEAIL